MDDRQVLLGNLWITTLGNSEVLIAALTEASIAAPIVSNDQRSRRDGALDEPTERLGATVEHDGEPNASGIASVFPVVELGARLSMTHLDGTGDENLVENRPGVLRCRKCRQNTGLTVGTVMERSHTPLNVWFWAAYLVASQTPGMSAVQFQRQLGLSRYETAFQILHKLRSGMVRPNQDRIGGQPKNHVEVDETWVGGRTRGEGRGVHHKVPVSCAIEVRHRKPGTKLDNRKDGRYAGRVRLAVVLDRSAGECQKICARAVLSDIDEPFAEDDGELCFGLEPFPRRTFPRLGRMIENEI